MNCLQVYLPSIEGHLPPNIVRTFHAFLEFCYIACRNVHNETTLQDLRDALGRFHQYQTAFIDAGIHFNFSLPRQHSMVHYFQLVCMFGAPNGLCSSITESKHIKAVKKPWRRSSQYKALGQMLLTNQCLDVMRFSLGLGGTLKHHHFKLLDHHTPQSPFHISHITIILAIDHIYSTNLA
jgi:hypothetical protein